MQNEPCHINGTCEFLNRCTCSGNDHLRCAVTYQVGGISFVDKESHAACSAKIFFGDAHICICPANPGQR